MVRWADDHDRIMPMIVLNLTCAHDHRFEGWFASGAEFDRQASAGTVACPVCGDHAVARLPSSPHFVKGAPAPEGAPAPAGTKPQRPALRDMLNLVHAAWNESEDVGDRFPEEARRIHYHETPTRSIRGVATRTEANDLLEEGIQVMALPLPPTDKLH
jgi:hypothetical protein